MLRKKCTCSIRPRLAKILIGKQNSANLVSHIRTINLIIGISYCHPFESIIAFVNYGKTEASKIASL